MSTPTTSLILLRQAIAKKLYSPFTPIVSTTTGAGAGGYLEDSAISVVGSEDDLTGAWLMIVEAGGGAALNEICRVYNTDFSGGGTLYVLPGWTGAPGNGINYEIHRWFHPTYVRDKINEILQSMKHEVLLALTMCLDGNMETSGTTNWTSSAATLTKETTGTFVTRGTQALKVVATGAPGQARSATINVYPGEELIVASEVYVTAGDSVRLVLYNVDVGDEIETAALVTYSGYAMLMFKAKVPAGCTQVALRLEATNNGDVAYFSNAICLPTRRHELLSNFFPDLEWGEDFRGVVALPIGNPIVDTGADNAYELFSTEMVPEPGARLERRDQSANPWSIIIPKGYTIQRPLFIKMRRDYPTLSADTDTTYAPADVVQDLVVAELLDEKAFDEINEIKSKQLEKRATRIREKLDPRMMEIHKPRGKINGAIARWTTG